MDFLSAKTIQAKKHYDCDACEWWRHSGFDESCVTADEWLSVEAAKADKWKILPGQLYRKVVYVDGGEIHTYRARVDMDLICKKYELFDD